MSGGLLCDETGIAERAADFFSFECGGFGFERVDMDIRSIMGFVQEEGSNWKYFMDCLIFDIWEGRSWVYEGWLE